MIDDNMIKGKSKLFEIAGSILVINIYTFSIDKIQFSYLAFYISIFLILLFSNLKDSIKYDAKIIVSFVPVSYLFFSLIYTYDFNKGFRFTLFFTTFLLIHIILGSRDDWHKSFYKTILVMSSILVAVTFFSYFFPSLYKGLFLPLFSQEKQIVMLKLMSAGAQVGLTHQTAVNGFLISIGLGILVNALINYKKSKLLMYSSIIIYTIALIMTLKRSFLIANTIAIIITIYISFKFRNKKNDNYLKFFIAIIMIIIIVFKFQSFMPSFNEIIRRFTFNNFRDFTSGRNVIYRAGYELFKESPLIGKGIYSTPDLLRDRFGLDGIQQMHNIYLQFLTEIGLIGTLVFMFLITTIYLTTYRLIRKAYLYKEKDAKFMLGISFYIQNFWLIYGFFGNPFTEHAFLLTYLIFASIPLYYNRELKKVSY